MCYSKEVSFLVGTTMVAGCAYTWLKYVKDNLNENLKSVYNNILVGYLCVAIHQFGDFLSIATGSELVYQIGLIGSITCMYFYMRSLEKLSHLSFGSTIFALLIGLCAIQILLTQFNFENLGFWVRGDGGRTYLLWSGLWLALFIYWNICILYFRRLTPSRDNKRLLIYYGMYSINISFILYCLYAYFSLLVQKASWDGLLNGWNVFTSFDIAKDSPSIWCAFSVIQIFFIPLLFKMMNEKYKFKANTEVQEVSLSTKFLLVGISAIIWLILLFGLPIVFGAASKIVAG